MASSIQDTKLDFWVANNKNVLFVGKHGVGKTAMVNDTFSRHNLNWRYYSASTMDPWVDFIGVPREKSDDKIPEQFDIIKELYKIDIKLACDWVQSNWHMDPDSAMRIVKHAVSRKPSTTYLDLVRPQSIAAGDVEALFFDEYNRSPKKVRNAVMELIQFGSINGLKFPKLKFVWAAINPDDDENQTYDVERLDPAQADRFHVTVEVPYKPNADWFRKKYGSDVADAAIEWWSELADDQKNLISPRRLQYALDVYREKGDMRDVLPHTSNVSKLTTSLNSGPATKKLEKLMTSRSAEDARNFLQNENNYASAMRYILKSDTMVQYFVPLLPKEKIAALMNDDDKISNFIIHNSDKVPIFRHVCKEILDAGANKRLCTRIRRIFTENQALAASFASNNDSSADPSYSAMNSNAQWNKVLNELRGARVDNSQQVIQVYEKIVKEIPMNQTADEALATLVILNKMFDGQFTSMITGNSFGRLIGIVNNCIEAINRETGLSFHDILKTHGANFKVLLENIRAAGLDKKLFTVGAK